MNREILLAPGINEITPGLKVKVTPLSPFSGVIPGRTALHEAQHVVINPRNIRRASINPTEEYLGFAQPYTFDAISAAAPHAMGSSGTSHDLRLIEWHGHDSGAAGAAARSILSNLGEEVHAVAALLQTKGEISGFEAEEVMKQVASQEAEIEITDSSGKVRNFVSKTRKGQGHFITIGLAEPEYKTDEKAA